MFLKKKAHNIIAKSARLALKKNRCSFIAKEMVKNVVHETIETEVEVPVEAEIPVEIEKPKKTPKTKKIIEEQPEQ